MYIIYIMKKYIILFENNIDDLKMFSQSSIEIILFSNVSFKDKQVSFKTFLLLLRMKELFRWSILSAPSCIYIIFDK